MMNRALAPDFKRIENIEFKQAERLVLNNKVPVFLINSGSQPVLRLEVIIKAGSILDVKPGSSYFTSKMLQEGTKTKSSKEIARYLDKYGAFLEVNSGSDFVIISIYTLSRHLSSVLPVLFEILQEPSFPQDELETLKTIKIQNTKVNQEKTNYLASVSFKKAIFNDHPYGKELSEKEISDIHSDDLIDHYKRNFSGSWNIILSGFTSDENIKDIENYFGNIPFKSTVDYASKPVKSHTGRKLIEKEDSLQSSIRVGKLMFTKNHPDFIKLKIVNEILGGYFGSRLMKNIREEKGFTYGIQSNLVSLRNEGYFVIGTDVKKEFTQQTLEEIHKELNILQSEPVETQELDIVKNYMIGSFLSEINTPFALADKFKSVYLSGLDYDYYQNLINTINSITSEDILETTQKHLKPESMTEVIAGGI